MVLLEMRGMPHRATGSSGGAGSRSRSEGKAWGRAFCVPAGKAGQGSGGSLGLASVGKVGGLWTVGVVCSCLVLTLGD